MDRSATTLCLSLAENLYWLPYSSVIPTGWFGRLVRVMFPQTASAVPSAAPDTTKSSKSQGDVSAKGEKTMLRCGCLLHVQV